MGRRQLQAKVTTKEYEDGRRDVTIKVPMMDLKAQCNEVEWEAVLTQLINKKYRHVKLAIENSDKSDEEKTQDWAKFVRATLDNAEEKSIVGENYTIRSKNEECAKDRAYNIAEKYKVHLFIPESK